MWLTRSSSGGFNCILVRPRLSSDPMTTTIRAQVSIDSDTALPRDVCQNTWHFQTTNVDPLDGADEANTILSTFYNAIAMYLSENLVGGANVKFYDLQDPEPRTPIATSAFSFTVGTGTCFPNEVASCMSYRAAGASGSPTKRRRGRLFIGPLAAATSANGNGDAQLDPSWMTVLCDAMEEAAAPIGNTRWVVFSPTTAGATPWSDAAIAAASFPVVAGYVDNAYDTVRSRGAGATDRESWSA